MNNIHNNGESESKLLDDLEQVDAAYKRLEQQEPPELLDQAVLSSAHRAVEKKTGWMQFGWLHGLTTAAVIVLAVSVILQQRESQPVFDESTGIHAPEPSIPQKAVEENSLQVSSKSRRSVISKDDTPTARQKIAAPTSPAITGNEAVSIERIQSRASSDEPAVEASGIMYEEMSEIRIDTDKKEIPPGDATDDEMDTITDVATEDLSADITREAKRELTKQAGNTVAEQLERIIALKKAGDDSWQAELQAFKQRFPDYPIPKDLEP